MPELQVSHIFLNFCWQDKSLSVCTLIRKVKAETLQSANETKNEQKDAYKNINTNVFYFPDQGMGAVYFNKGENCIAAGRLFVEESIHDEFVRKVVRQLKTEV